MFSNGKVKDKQKVNDKDVIHIFIWKCSGTILGEAITRLKDVYIYILYHQECDSYKC